MGIKKSLLGAALAAGLGMTGAANADVIAYWAQNSNDLPSGGFGFVASDFPQAADLGSGTLTLADFITTTGGTDSAYTTIQSFGGTDTSAQLGFAAGGSLSPQGGTDNGNNGMSIILELDLTDWEDVIVLWDQRGTSTGFNSRVFSYSTDGVSYTNVAYTGDTGALTSTWTTPTIDLTSVSAIEGASTVYFKITLAGATGSTGNNRFDNITVSGTLVPEPATLTLLGLGGLTMMGGRRRRSA